MIRDHATKVLNDENDPTDIPTKSDGTKYDIDDLSDEQRMIVLATVDTVVKFLENDEDYKPLRATITGMGGFSGIDIGSAGNPSGIGSGFPIGALPANSPPAIASPCVSSTSAS